MWLLRSSRRSWQFWLACVGACMLEVVNVAKVIEGVCLIDSHHVSFCPAFGLCHCLVEFELIRLTVISEHIAAPTIITAQHMFTLCRCCLFSVLAVTDLTEQGWISEVGLDLVFLFAYGSFVKEAICFLLQGLNVVFVHQFCAVQLLYQLLVNAGFRWCPFRAELNIDEVKDPILELFPISLIVLAIFRTVVCVV